MTRRSIAIVVATLLVCGMGAFAATMASSTGPAAATTQVLGDKFARTIPDTATGNGSAPSNTSNGTGNGNASNASNDKGTFSISSHPAAGQGTVAIDAGPLYPGVTRPLVLTVNNPNSFDIVITALTVSIGTTPSPSTPGFVCPASSLTVSGLPAAFSLAGKGSTTKTVFISMNNNVPDQCQGAAWPLAYGGSAVKPNKA